MNLVISSLGRHHERNNFDCGEPELNVYLQRFARQQADKDFSRTYVATLPGEAEIRGFYALSSASVHFENMPTDLHLPRYPVPVARIGRLAVDTRFHGQGVGVLLLQSALGLAASLSQQIGIYAVTVDAKSASAAAFYKRFGFQEFVGQASSLFVTTQWIRRAATLADGSN